MTMFHFFVFFFEMPLISRLPVIADYPEAGYLQCAEARKKERQERTERCPGTGFVRRAETRKAWQVFDASLRDSVSVRKGENRGRFFYPYYGIIILYGNRNRADRFFAHYGIRVCAERSAFVKKKF